ncbi:MAG: glycoside hydrolase family 2 protein [Treponema sp.]|jgi:beta-mannosidase|nr:glycoside hydrolase family 2 protein [Treponema sp.]
MIRLTLDGAWKLETLPGGPVFDAEVPGSVLDTWIKAGAVPDPYYGENEKKITPLFEKDFEYRRTFTAAPELLAEDKVELVCLGIDTLGEIFINGALIGRVNNMHREWRFNVKKALTPGENAIRVTLFSPAAFTARAYREGPVRYVGAGTMAGSGYLRKAHSQFGWDWGPMLPDAGIWRSLWLEGWSTARLADVYITQEHPPARGGPVTVRARARAELAELRRFWAEDRSLTARLRITPPGADAPRGDAVLETETAIADIREDAELSLVIENPSLWWPNGLGSGYGQPLYDVELRLEQGRAVLDTWKRRAGLRTMTISAEKDQWGREFTLTVNGVKLFSMGADYIPEDSVFPRINPRRTRRLLEDCARANFNSVRVWGGGYYPDDYFYDACDELGLVVWQDLMFACNVYELTAGFAANVREEVRQNMIRLRHHACLGLWCGNNEMEVAWREWEGVKNHSAALRADYIRLFEGLIPEVWRETDPRTFYWPASPSSGGGFDAPNDPDRGDVHYWEVWHGLKPFSAYREYLFRYCSEFGFESLPDLETIRCFAGTEDLNLFSPALEAHQRCPGGNGKILYYLSETYRYPKDFASLVYISQILQMESIQSGVDHWRRNRGRCMGAVYWQLNDCWPAASWAGIDYYGRWKALHYGARRFFAPIRATVFVDQTEAAPPGSLAGPLARTVRVFVHNDTMSGAAGKLFLSLKRRDFTVLREETLDVALPALSASEVLVRDYRALVNTTELERSCFVTAELRLTNGAALPVSRETALFVPPKYFSFRGPRYTVDVADREGEFAITLRADTFCRFVRIKIPGEDPVFSDNYVDITGEEGVEITVRKSGLRQTYSAETLRALLSAETGAPGGAPVMSVGDTY